MADDEIQRWLETVREFGWDPRKHEINRRVHKIDFDDARLVFDDYALVRRSDRHGEIRYQIFGYLEEREVTVVFARRDPLCWIISARRAHRSERRKYYDRLPR